MEGWVTLHRKFLQWEWFDKPEMVQLFIWLLLNANYADKKWQGVELKRGQLVITTTKLREALKFTEQRTRTCLERLKSTGEIITKSTNRFTIVTICNYDKYQDVDFPSNGQNNGQSNGQTTDEQRTEQQTNNGRLYDICTVTNNETSKQLNNNISLCNDTFDAHTREQRERDEIFKIFFCKNFVNPGYEVERFYNHYEAQGWERGNGQKITNRLAAARSWEQEDKTKKRFPDLFVRAMCEICEELSAEDATRVMRGIVRIEVDKANITIILNAPVHKLIDINTSPLRTYMARNIFYSIIRAN